MKTIFTSFLICLFALVNAQADSFIHKATSANISSAATYLDHPRLNNNPNAEFVVSHLWNTQGSSGVFNNKILGLYYDGVKWYIYNQDYTDFIPNSSFFVYIPSDDKGAQFTVTSSNLNDGYADLDYVELNNNPNAVVATNPIFTNYYNKNVGVWYTGSKWSLYNENATYLEIGQKFMVVFPETDETKHLHISSASNTYDNITKIDHPLLNNNPNAKFVFMHNWGESGHDYNITYDKVVGAWYDGSRWCLFNQDATTFPSNIAFNIIIDGSSMGIEEAEMISSKAYPNPMINEVTIESKNLINEIQVFNILGKEVLKSSQKSKQVKLDVSSLTSGSYLFKIHTVSGVETQKLIKK